MGSPIYAHIKMEKQKIIKKIWEIIKSLFSVELVCSYCKNKTDFAVLVTEKGQAFSFGKPCCISCLKEKIM
jgi:hypothetical protein